MGRRSRKRSSVRPAAGAPTRPVEEAPRAPLTPRSRRDAAPPAPWGSFPLVELCVLIAIGIGIWGFATRGSQGGIMLGAAMVLGSLAGLEISIREHFAGYRSHSSLLAGAIAIAAIAGLFFARAPHVALAPVGAAVFGVAFWALRGAFKRRSGGLVIR